ncbi:recombination-associated protein RdgC [Oceanimonas pelagia]|uniref:Recombination-associated protein RdgC n=1 Tax=Oceanimonas pelagia TaxID=3028314 RepID=A0AA50KQ81_9GAMM|nr:recombination-associated protein RdgC [Oceanimonas pelagia]WMC11713.1 recombination-associated protein RdgC [Oceanimonas pelagia]
MIFKSLMIYRFTCPFELTAEELEQQLATLPFTPCGSQEQTRFGWVSPLGKQGQTLTHIAGRQILICAKREEKMLPTSVVNDEVAEKVEALEAEEGRALKKKEKDAIKEEVIVSLLPRAFSRFQQTMAWINPDAGFIAVDASSVRRAEDVLALLRKSIGSLPVVPLAMTTPPELTLTDWLKAQQAPAGFSLEDEAELRSALEHGGIIRAKQQNLLDDEMKAHLDADKLVTSLALNWADSLSFVLKDDMSIKRMKFSEELREQNDDVGTEDVLARFDADFTLITGELTRFIADLIEAMGGEERDGKEQAA